MTSNPKKQTSVITSFFTMEGAALEVERCTELLGLEPTDTFPESQVVGRDVVTGEDYMRRPSWTIRRYQEPSESTEAHLRTILDPVWAAREGVKAARQQMGLEIYFGSNVTVRGECPRLELSPLTIRQIASLGGSWLLDLL